MERLTRRTEDGLVMPVDIISHTKVLEKLAMYEDLEERGLLKKLPCRLGGKLYDICEFIEGDDSPDIYVIDASRIELSEDKAGMSYCIDSVDYRDYDFGTKVFTSEEVALEAIRSLGWII